MLEELSRQKTMQLATEHNGQPWICTVYFVVHSGNFYWLSFPERRHSQELVKNPRAAIAIPIKCDAPVIGVQCSGEVEIVSELGEVAVVMEKYVEKYSKGEKFVELYKRNKNHHFLYCLKPKEIVVFDEVNNLKDARRTYLHLEQIGA